MKTSKKVLCTALTCTLMMGSYEILPVRAEEKKDPEEGKDETVYVITDSSGNPEDVIVSDWLKNPGKGTKEDASILNDIRNVSGNESFTKDGDGKLVWNSEGKDIYYQGTTDKELPVNVRITYELDGKKMSAEEIAGKKGHVKIRFDYENKMEQTVNLNGKDTVVHVPFAVVSGMELDTSRFSSIRVTNGKLISEGKKTFAIGLAFPGLEESLALDQEEKDKLGDISIPSFVEIEADTDDFESGMTMTVVSSDLLSDMDMDFNTSDLQNAFDQLESAADELVDGSESLKDGTRQLKDGSEKLKDGSEALNDGVSKLDDGSSDLKDGADALADGAKSLEDGISSLKDGIDAYTDGFEQVADGVTQADTGAASLKEGTEEIASGTEQFADGASAVSEGINTLDEGARTLNDGAKQYAGMLKGSGTAEDPGLEERVHQLYNGSVQLSDGTGEALESLKKTQSEIRELEKMTQGSSSAEIALKYNSVLQAAEKMAEAKAVLEAMQNKPAAAPKKSAPAKTENSADLSALEEQNQTLSEENKTLSENNEKLSNENKSLQEQLAALQSEKDDLKKQLEEEKNKGCETVPSSISTPEIKEIPESWKDAEPENALPEEDTESKEEASENKEEEPALTEEEPIEASSRKEDHIVMLGSSPSTAEEAMQNFQKAKADFEKEFQEYTVLVTANGDSVFSSQLMVLDQTLGQIIGDEDSGMTALDAGAKQLSAGLEQLDAATPQIVQGAEQIEAGTAQLVSGIEDKQEGAAASLKDGAQMLSDNASVLSSGASQLDDGMKDLQTGISKLKDGADQLSENSSALKDGASDALTGAKDLKEGADKVDDGTKQLNSGIESLGKGASALDKGIGTLLDGAKELDRGTAKLAAGMRQYKEDGIDKLTETLGTKLPETTDRLQAILQAGKSYQSFAGNSSSDNDRVKFIFRTEGVKKE